MSNEIRGQPAIQLKHSPALYCFMQTKSRIIAQSFYNLMVPLRIHKNQYLLQLQALFERVYCLHAFTAGINTSPSHMNKIQIPIACCTNFYLQLAPRWNSLSEFDLDPLLLNLAHRTSPHSKDSHAKAQGDYQHKQMATIAKLIAQMLQNFNTVISIIRHMWCVDFK